MAQLSFQAIAKTRRIATRDGKPHRCRPKALPGDWRHPRRPDHGRAVNWLRAFVFYLVKRQSGRSPWVELDLTRACNSKGLSLSAVRWLWRRLKADPLFCRYIKVRYVQKVGPDNGWFVIIAAWRPNLQWDQEPLFYGRDRETTRHVRAELRDEDIESAGRAQKKTRDCPKSIGPHYTVSLPKEQPCQNTPAGTENRPSLRSAGSSGETPLSKGFEDRIFFAIHRPDWNEPNRLGRTLCRKCAIVVRHLQSDFFTNGRFAWPEAHAWNFVSWALVNGFDVLRISQAWRGAVEQTVADMADGMPRVPAAWLMFHAKRIANEIDPRPRADRIRSFYKSFAAKAASVKKEPLLQAPVNFEQLRDSVSEVQEWTSKKHID